VPDLWCDDLRPSTEIASARA